MLQIGAIADDVTGGTDLASTWRQRGLDVVQTIGLPDQAGAPLPPADAVIVSLKTRTAPAADAVALARQAAAYLRRAGAARLFFKYCSTFDSTDAGNIGPVTDALLDDLGAPLTIACPAYPAMGRSVYLGHLFVGSRLLSESSMRHHPLTPMTDADLVRVLGRQMRDAGPSGPVGLVPLATVEAGADATRARFDTLAQAGHRAAIADAVFDRHLDTLAESCVDLALVTGAAGLGRSLARPPRAGAAPRSARAAAPDAGPAAVLSGSCSAATQEQVRRLAATVPSRGIDPCAIAADARVIAELADWACERIRHGPVLLYSTASANRLREVQAALGVHDGAALVEHAFRTVAAALAGAGIRTFIVAGGETSGAVLEALAIRVLAFGEEIEPGIPWTWTIDPPGYRFALKSGNFGAPDFFAAALGGRR